VNLKELKEEKILLKGRTNQLEQQVKEERIKCEANAARLEEKDKQLAEIK
jgi:hypothetical protein